MIIMMCLRGNMALSFDILTSSSIVSPARDLSVECPGSTMGAYAIDIEGTNYFAVRTTDVGFATICIIHKNTLTVKTHFVANITGPLINII